MSQQTPIDWSAAAELIDLKDHAGAQLSIEHFGARANEHSGAYGRFLKAVVGLLADNAEDPLKPIVFSVEDLRSHLTGEDLAHFTHGRSETTQEVEVAHQVDRYNREDPPQFCETEFYVKVGRSRPTDHFKIEVVLREELLAAAGRFKPPVHVKFRQTNIKSKKLRSLDKYHVVARFYVFATLLIVNIAVAVILGASARLLSYSLYLPAIYTIYLIYTEAMFINNRIKLIRSVYSQKVRVKTLTYNDDKTMVKISKFEVRANCPICRGTLNLATGGPYYNGQIVARCENAYAAHVFSFDHTRGTGHFLN